MASCGGETLEDSSGDKKFAFVPGRKPKDMSETIISAVYTGVGEGGESGGSWGRVEVEGTDVGGRKARILI